MAWKSNNMKDHQIIEVTNKRDWNFIVKECGASSNRGYTVYENGYHVIYFLRRFFNEYREAEFPSAGFVPSNTITIHEGPLPSEFIHSMEPMLRKLGMPVLLKKGVIVVLSDYKICRANKPITPEQSRLLVSILLLYWIWKLIECTLFNAKCFVLQKLFGHKLDEFKVTLNYVWSKSDGSLEKL